MPEWDSSEANVVVQVEDPEAYDGHMDSRPVRLVGGNQSMSPAEAYHLADDLTAAADACWGAAEYVVMAVTDVGNRFLGEVKAEDPVDAVDRVQSWLKDTGGKKARSPPPSYPDEERGYSDRDKERIDRWAVSQQAERFHVYRSDTLEAVTADQLGPDQEPPEDPEEPVDDP